MRQFTTAVRQAVSEHNWYAALSLALIIPDICGRLDNPHLSTQDRYVYWYNRWLLHKYSANIAKRGLHVFLSGNDCYALRCSFTHEGREDISEQRAREVLANFAFSTPHPQINIHCQQVDRRLQLNVAVFALDVCNSVDEWLNQHRYNPILASRINEMIIIHETSDGIPGLLTMHRSA